MGFIKTTPPTGFAHCSFPSNRFGVFYEGEAPTVTLNVSVSCTYTVRDYFGNVVSSGAASGTSISPAAPVGGWARGWYRFYLDGTTTDSVYGTSLGATNFVVIRNDSRWPARPAVGYWGTGHGGSEAQDEVAKGWMSMGTTRRQIADASNPTSTIDSIGVISNNSAPAREFWSDPVHTQYLDSERPRYLWIQFPNRTWDRVDINNGSFAHIYCKDGTVDGSKVFAGMTGSAGNWTVTIYYPDTSTPVETYSGITSGLDLENATKTSSYVRAYNFGSSGVATSPTAIGNAYFNGVSSTVAALYPYGITRYEGPANEGDPSSSGAVHRMRLFQAAVHAGNAGAKAIGPCPVEIGGSYLAKWDTFLANGGGDYCDELSFHAYNSSTNGNIAQGRSILGAFMAKLAQYGQDSKPLWCTESTNVFTSVAGVLHPRRARVIMLSLLLMEQYGIRREQNLVWYDEQHGFDGYPSWSINTDESLQPYAALCRVLAEETFGYPYSNEIDFGNDAANAIFLGNLYTAGSASVIALIAASHIDSATVTLAVSGTSGPLTVVDGFGNESSIAISGGVVTVPVDDVPTYVRLPAGASASVHHVLNWPNGQADSVSTQATTHTVGGTNAPAIADGGWLTNYGAQTGIYVSPNLPPEDAILLFPSLRTVKDIAIFCGASWQHDGAFVDFDVDTTSDGGSTWTTRKTVTKATPSSFWHGCDLNNSGCKQETYWDEQWIFPVSFDSRLTVDGVRVHVRSTSYGGEPDAAANAAGGQGQPWQGVALQEISVLPASNLAWTTPTVNVRAGGGWQSCAPQQWNGTAWAAPSVATWN